jgi:tRNA pseudouridine65 synthase
MINIPILYQDDHLVLVDKPVDLPVHKNKHMAYDVPYLTKLVGDQTGKWVYNVHRLDAKTSGLVLLAFSSDMARELTRQFEKRTVVKSYLAIVKGEPGEGVFEEPVLDRKKGKRVAAKTTYRTLQTVKTDLSSKGVDDLSLSLISLQPHTGRWHQLRQHCSRQRYDIIGDTQHGDWTLNRLITDRTGAHRLCLHAQGLEFKHPVTESQMTMEATTPEIFSDILAHWEEV